MGHPSVSEWESDPSILASGTRGFNMLTEIPRLLRKHYSWLGDFEIGFCDKDDLPGWLASGWRWLKTEHFDIDNYNQAVGLRFGFSDDGGNIKWRENYLMIMPKDVRKRQVAIRNEESERMFSAQTGDQKYVSKADPRGQELLSNEDVVYSELEEKFVKTAPASDETPKRGRPRKN